MVCTAEHFDGVGEKVRNDAEGFDCALGAAWEIDDKSVVAGDGDAAREKGCRCFLCTLATDFLSKARDGAIGDVEGCFRRVVAGAEAGATRGQVESGVAGVGNGPQLAADFRTIVGTAERRGDFPTEFATASDESGAGEVLAFSASDRITEGEKGDAHGQVISYQFSVISKALIWCQNCT